MVSGPRLLSIVCGLIAALFVLGAFWGPAAMLSDTTSVGPGATYTLFVALSAGAALFAALAAMFIARTTAAKNPGGPQIVVGPLLLLCIGGVVFGVMLLARGL